MVKDNKNNKQKMVDDYYRPKKKKNNPMKGQLQEQMHDKTQLQMQKYSHFTMATVLSTAENIIYRLALENKIENELFKEYKKIYTNYPNKLIFESYDSYDSGKNKTLNSLIYQFIFQIENYADDFNEFESDFGEYVYPQNMGEKQIMKIIDIWIKILNNVNQGNNYLKYFINLKNIFAKKPIKSYENEIRDNYKNNPRSGKANPYVIQREYANATNVINQRTKDIDNQNIDLFGQMYNY